MFWHTRTCASNAKHTRGAGNVCFARRLVGQMRNTHIGPHGPPMGPPMPPPWGPHEPPWAPHRPPVYVYVLSWPEFITSTPRTALQMDLDGISRLRARCVFMSTHACLLQSNVMTNCVGASSWESRGLQPILPGRAICFCWGMVAPRASARPCERAAMIVRPTCLLGPLGQMGPLAGLMGALGPLSPFGLLGPLDPTAAYWAQM